MWNLFVTERRKYRKPVLIVSFAHTLALLYMLSRGTNLTDKPWFPLWLILIAAMGATLGLVQMLGHKRGNHWIHLLQRPLHHRRILISLLAAGCCHLLVACLLPFLVLLLVMDGQAIWGIEMRHYLVLPLAATATLSGYFMAGFAALSPQRLAFLVFPLIMLLVINFPNTHIFATAGLLAAWFFAAVYVSFKPDLSLPPQTSLELVTMELPIQCGLFWVVTALLALTSEVSWTLSGTHPSVHPQANTAFAILQESPRQRLLSALEGATHPDAELLRRQSEIGEITDVPAPTSDSFPVRNQRPSLDNALSLLDEDGRTTWQFSHSSMLFEGINRDSRQRAGWLGASGFQADAPSAEPFLSVPWVTDNTFITNDRSIYLFDWDRRTITRRFDLDTIAADPGERFSDSLAVGAHVTTIQSNSHLYIFRTAELVESPYALESAVRVPREHVTGQREVMHVVELLDGYLVFMLAKIPPLSDGDFALYEPSELLLYRARDNMDNELIHRRILTPALGDLQIYRSLIVAPGMRMLVDAYSAFYLNQGKERAFPLLYHDIPLLVLMLAGLASAASAGFTWHLLRQSRLSLSVRLSWTVVNAVGGLVGLLSLILGSYWKKLPLAPSPQPAPVHAPFEVCKG